MKNEDLPNGERSTSLDFVMFIDVAKAEYLNLKEFDSTWPGAFHAERLGEDCVFKIPEDGATAIYALSATMFPNTRD